VSHLAEFARELHESSTVDFKRELEPVDYQSHEEKLHGIRAVIFDVYGTLINYWRAEFSNPEAQKKVFFTAFRAVADRFGFIPFLQKMNEPEAPEKTLYDLYNGLITLSHEKAVQKGLSFPEVKTEDIWGMIMLMLKRHGYDPKQTLPVDTEELPRYCAFCYNFHAFGRTLYSGVTEALLSLKKQNIVLGILSNAQFNTPIDLTLALRDQSRGAVEDINELFDHDLCYFSYEYGVAKPDLLLFRKLFDALYEYQILPSQTVFIGNDLSLDIDPAAKAGMRTALFTGDRSSLFLHGKEETVVPDLSFSSWDDLTNKISFFSEGAAAS
jgi:putative hydrolase of the HAD superfamily